MKMDQNCRQYLHYVKDMFSSRFDPDIIESVLVTSNWNVDKAIDVLMMMSASDESVHDPVTNSTITNNSVPSCASTKTDQDMESDNQYDDDLIVVDEEEYTVVVSDAEEEGSMADDLEKKQNVEDNVQLHNSTCSAAVDSVHFPNYLQTRSTSSYASAAQKPSSDTSRRRQASAPINPYKPPQLIFEGHTTFDRIKRTRDSIEKIKLFYQRGLRIIVILRGCSGSGKSTLARRILAACGITENEYYYIHSTDNFFRLNSEGMYKINLSELSEAHAWNAKYILRVLKEGLTPVIIDNTHTMIWEMEQVTRMAVSAGYEIEVVEPDTSWVFHARSLFSKNIHSVSATSIEKQLSRYEHKINASLLLKKFGLAYQPSVVPPQLGVRTLIDQTLRKRFDQMKALFNQTKEEPFLSPVRKKKVEKKLKKQMKKMNKMLARKKKLDEEKLCEEEARKINRCVVEIDQLTETDSANSAADTDECGPVILEENYGSNDSVDVSYETYDSELETDDDSMSSGIEDDDEDANITNDMEKETLAKDNPDEDSSIEYRKRIENTFIPPSLRLSCFRNTQDNNGAEGTSGEFNCVKSVAQVSPTTSAKLEFTDQTVNKDQYSKTSPASISIQNDVSCKESTFKSVCEPFPVSGSLGDKKPNIGNLISHSKSNSYSLDFRKPDQPECERNLQRNIISNDLWGDSKYEREVLEDSSDDSADSKSNSSCSKKLVITDVHNTSTRFVNNNIQSEKPKNWDKNEPSLSHKVLNQDENAEAVEDSGEGSLGLPQRSEKKSNLFSVKNKSEDSLSSESSTADLENNKYLCQWMKGDGWNDHRESEEKRNDMECKSQRKVRDSPNYSAVKKNSETAGNIRLVNDIRSNSGSPKQLDKKTNQECAAGSTKQSNFNHSSSIFNSISKTTSKDLLNSGVGSSFSFWPTGVSESACSTSSDKPINTNADLKNTNPTVSSDSKLCKNCNNINFSPALLHESSKDPTEEMWEMNKWSPTMEISSSNVENCRMNTVMKNEMATDDMLQLQTPMNNFLMISSQPIEDTSRQCSNNKWTNTGIDDDSVAQVIHKIGRCREINVGCRSPDVTNIKSNYKCDKSTMTEEENYYSVKAKPMRKDLENLFPADKVDVILDLYEKCNANVDWMTEVLLEDGFFPNSVQLEYFVSLQNMDPCPSSTQLATFKEKKSTSKKKNKNKNSKQNRRCNPANWNCKNISNKTKDESSSEDANSPNNVEDDQSRDSNLPDAVPEDFINIFLDWSTVRNLLESFGNPTIYTVEDYQPIVKVPISLACQLHAYLIGSVIDQAEENEDAIKEVVEEDNQARGAESLELSHSDVTEMENNLNNILANETSFNDVRNEDSFASKLSLSLLLRSFPSLDIAFIKKTFKSKNFNYYEAKYVLNQYGREVNVDQSGESMSDDRYHFNYEDNLPLIESCQTSFLPGHEVTRQVNEFRKNAEFNHLESKKHHENMRVAVQEKKFGVAAYYREIMEAYKQKYEENNAQAAAVLVNSSCIKNSPTIDLHYFKVVDAITALDQFLDHHLLTLINNGRVRTVLFIITGHGTRSKDGVSRLQPVVKTRLNRRNINFEIEPCNEGLVKAILRKNSLMSTDLE